MLRPRDAVALEPPAGTDAGAVGALSSVVAGLVHAPRAAAAAFDLAGVRRAALADVVEQLPPPPSDDDWHRLYRGLEQLAADAATREALAALPVPLADGRVVRGPRGVVLPVAVAGEPAEELAGSLAVLGARVALPVVAGGRDVPAPARAPGRAADGGARRARAARRGGGRRGRRRRRTTPTPATTGGVSGTVRAVLTLVRQAVDAGALRPGDLPALAALPLPDTDGDLTPAGTLVLPGSAAARLLDEDEVGVVHPDLLAEWGRDTLAAVGVAAGLTLLRAGDVPVDAPPGDDARGRPRGCRRVARRAGGPRLGTLRLSPRGGRDRAGRRPRPRPRS